MNNNLAAELFETVTCPVCNAIDYSIIYPSSYEQGASNEQLVEAYRSSSDLALTEQLVSCKECTLVYLNPRVKEEIIVDGYKTAVDPVFINLNKHRIDTFTRCLSHIMKTHNIDPKNQNKVLDIGCAGGAFPKAANDLGFDVVGVEPSAWLSEEARKLYGLDIRTGILSEQQFETESFDLVTLWDVIEHLTDPMREVKYIRSLLKEKGRLIVNFPDYSSVARKLMGKKWPMLLNVHLFYFTPVTLERLLTAAGFRVVGVMPFWMQLSLGYVAHRASKYYSVFSQVEKLANTLGIGEWPVKYNIGQTLVVCEKIEAQCGVSA